jgi:transcriptional regulator with XRE-family HTH domain
MELIRLKSGKYAPLYIHRFKFSQPHFLNATPTGPSQLKTIADKLRYYRRKKALLQREVAEYSGIERTTYTAYEEIARDYYPTDTLARIAEILEVDIDALLDEYNGFLYYGQARQIKALRKRMNLTQADFAAHFGVNLHQIKRWEQGKARMTKKMWQKIFKTP